MQCLVVSLCAVSAGEFVQCLMVSLYAVSGGEFVCSVWWFVCSV